MKCLYPITIRNKIKNSDKGSAVGYKSFIQVPCGKCEACVKNKSEDWFVRLKFQQKYSDFVWFVTLTYDDVHLPIRFDENGTIFNDVKKDDIFLYHRRLRRNLSEKSANFKYYLTSEYGASENGTKRPHYHAIYFDIVPEDLPQIEKSWQNGFVKIDDVNDNRIRYVTGYIIEKLFVPSGREPVFNLISKGIGAKYIDVMKKWHNDDLNRFYAPVDGYKAVLPRYYRDKIYSPNMRKKHAEQCEVEARDKFFDKVEEIGFEEYNRLAHSVRSQYIMKIANHRKNKKRNF